MTKIESLQAEKTAKVEELKALRAKADEGEDVSAAVDEAIAAIGEIDKSIAATKEAVDKANAALAQIGKDEPAGDEEGDAPMEDTAKSLGENFVKAAQKNVHGKKFDVVAPEF